MSCQVLIACVTNAVSDLARPAESTTWSVWLNNLITTAPEPIKLLGFILCILIALFIIMVMLALWASVVSHLWDYLLPPPSKVKKREYGRFIEDPEED